MHRRCAIFGRPSLLTTLEKRVCLSIYKSGLFIHWVLLAELRRWKVKLKLMEKVEAITCEDRIWKVRTGTWTYEAERLILSCGSKCAPTTGSDGSGYRLAKMAGLKLIPVVPALAALRGRRLLWQPVCEVWQRYRCGSARSRI